MNLTLVQHLANCAYYDQDDVFDCYKKVSGNKTASTILIARRTGNYIFIWKNSSGEPHNENGPAEIKFNSSGKELYRHYYLYGRLVNQEHFDELRNSQAFHRL